MDLIMNHILDSATIATDLIFNRMCMSSEPLMIAVEDTRRDDVIGFGRVFISTDYYHPKLSKCSNNSKMHIRYDWSKSRIKTEVFDFLRNTNILPRFVECENEVIDLNKRLNELKLNIGYWSASKNMEDLKLKYSSITVSSI